MEKIVKNIKIENNTSEVFQKFIQEINYWWPKEYTWSQEKLEEMKIDGKKDGLCTEIGPCGFRCDWGRVVELKVNEQIRLKWQISLKREPIPNPEKSSDIKIEFIEHKKSYTKLHFSHYNFDNHGDGAKDYQKMMDGEQGWDFILNSFKEFCEK